MSLAITATKTRFRFDSPILPEYTVTGIVHIGRVFIYAKDAVNLYVSITNSTPFSYEPTNQSANRTLQVRDVYRPSWTLGTNVSLDSSDPLKSTANSNSGAYIGSLPNNCSIEGSPTSLDKKCGVSLQSGSVDYTENAEHCIIFQEDGLMAVYEAGVRKEATLRSYQDDDIGLIDKQGDIIRYYLVRDGILHLLRTTRSQLDNSDIKGVIILYHIGAKLENAFVFNDVSITKTLEVVGVFSDLQGWFNDYIINPTAVSLVAQDNNPEFTYNNAKKTIRQLTAARNLVNREERREFVNFYNYHITDKEFIFIDYAKRDTNNKPEWFWARFGSGFGDKTRAGCVNEENVLIVETFRNDIIPLEIIDTDPPTMPELTGVIDGWEWTESTDEVSDASAITYFIEIDIA